MIILYNLYKCNTGTLYVKDCILYYLLQTSRYLVTLG